MRSNRLRAIGWGIGDLLCAAFYLISAYTFLVRGWA